MARVYKYKKFSNFEDLKQVGFEALLLALKTYNIGKADFTWWADKYINTRISRAANAHSTIKIPIQKAKNLKPHKVKSIPTMLDSSLNPEEELQNLEEERNLKAAMQKLSEQHRAVINMSFGLNGITRYSISNIVEVLSISKPQCLKLLEEAKEKLKEIMLGQDTEATV